MVHTVSKMASQLKNIEIQMGVLMKESLLECLQPSQNFAQVRSHRLEELTRVKSQVP